MKHVYSDTLKHFTLYSIGQIVCSCASILLLPIYTRYLRPADYGCMAILDLFAIVLEIMIGSGMASAVGRYYFESSDSCWQRRVWWTGIVCVALLASAVVVPAWCLRDTLASLALGFDEGGSLYFALILPTIWFGAIGELGGAYLRVRKWSGRFLCISLARLALNVSLNVYFLAALDLGIAGILLGNLITRAVVTCVLLAIVAWHHPVCRIQMDLARNLLRFGLPLIGTTILALVMHQGDRYVLRLFVDMNEVGVYSVAYMIGQGLNSLILMPFGSIWGVKIYEIAQSAQAKELYADVFRHFFGALTLIMLGVSLFAKAILAVVVPPEYLPAAELIPIVCLAYVFFSLHKHFEVPALLAKRTISLLPASILAASFNIGANLCVIPSYRTLGAAWVSVVTFVVFSSVGLVLYRSIDRYDYPFGRCGLILAGMTGTFVGYRGLERLNLGTAWESLFAGFLWSCWAVILVLPALRKFCLRQRGRLTLDDAPTRPAITVNA